MLNMNEDIKAEWVAALRSGQYSQTCSYLSVVGQKEADYIPSGYCCLGVLCELAVQHGVIPPPHTQTDDNLATVRVYGEYDDKATALLPMAVVRWAGLADIDPPILYAPRDGSPRVRQAAALNDDLGMSFTEIADAIEQEVE